MVTNDEGEKDEEGTRRRVLHRSRTTSGEAVLIRYAAGRCP